MKITIKKALELLHELGYEVVGLEQVQPMLLEAADEIDSLTAQLAERDGEIARLKRKAQDAEKNVRKQMLDRAGRGLERYSITAEGSEVYCKPDPDGFYVTMGTVAALVEQLSTSQQEAARLQQQSVGWVAVFDENATLREEVERLKVTNPTIWQDGWEHGRKQAAQKCIEEAVLWIPTPSVAKYRRIMALKFGLEG